jgi:hypothetical protein
MKKALERLNLKGSDFPLKITMSSGEIHFLSSPKHIDMRPKTETLVSIKRRVRRRKAG